MLYKKNSSLTLAALIARRLMGTLTSQRQVSRLARICFLSTAIIACAFAVALAIMHGFQQATCTAFQNIHADVIIQPKNGRPLAAQKIGAVLRDEFGSVIQASAPYAEGYAIARTAAGDNLNHVVYIQGIDPIHDPETRALARTVITRGKNFTDLFADSAVVIGEVLAADLGVHVGENITLLFVPNELAADEQITLEQLEIRVGGIAKTGVDDLDNTLVICSHKTFAEIFPAKGITAIGLKLRPASARRSRQVLTQLQKRFPSLDIRAWAQLYPALEAAFRLERIALILIALLICLIASTNLMSLLLLFITHKRQTIGALRAMGVPLNTIRYAFFGIGNGLVLAATTVGLGCALIICLFIEKYRLISLPDAYYISHVPARLTLSILMISFLLNALCGLIATWWATRTISQLPLSTTLKGDPL
ncbi:MAG: ABC transporter permease [Candidatus Dependentiae bacterium]|nr:ABC transporter permease [Candidatus Dependentiae bacterium]